MSVVKALAEKGHNVTVVTLLKPKIYHENITNILIPPTENNQAKYESWVAELSNGKSNILHGLVVLLTTNRVKIDMQFEAYVDKRFTALYENSDNQFDVAILGYALNYYQLAIGAKFNCPIIVSWVQQPMEGVNALVGNPREISYVTTLMNAKATGEAWNFAKRLENYLFGTILKGVTLIIDHLMSGYYSKLTAVDPNLPTFEAMKRNVSLVFCNSHYSEGPIRPLTPATVLIGGIQIKEKPDPLPKNIADFLAASQQNGAILFSLGSNIKDSHIKPEILQIIYKVLSSLKQNVIWKWENLANTPGNASNILYQNWLPQDDILAQPNLRLFITHAGAGGIAESTFHGVPMVAIPIFADQPANSLKIVLEGFGVEVDFNQLTERAFRNAISEVLTNPSYANKVKAFSRLYGDRPMSARRSVVYWTEYVIRHRGAAHMQSPLVKMNYIQSVNLDVYLLILGTLFVVFKLLQLAWRYLWSKVFDEKIAKKPKGKRN
ncbi:UDP-glycosyltransferase UGT5-like [Rhagoletis pomonella]|uniref:UDP-glycosyltransferase UGT5-like n=1 Tax=Rhagoletis pomonella TaxID=28610 RepID=UPI00178713B0|nr:UDP-glycosyltransferase UGT5-like [Rhagoletis pomonella]